MSGAARFKVEACTDGSLPVDRAASLLAIHCLARRQAPSDFLIMVGTGDDLLAGVTLRAEQMLTAAWATEIPIRLSRREQEVLLGVLQQLANKEIAARLNLSERTVKFHVSSLLAKFGVRDRVGLMRDAAHFLLSADASRRGAVSELPGPLEQERSLDQRSRGTNPSPRAETNVLRLPGRLLTA